MDLDDSLDFIEVPINDSSHQQQTTCKGLVFRGYRSMFWKDGRIEERSGVRLLRKKSCPGCSQCGWYEEAIPDFIWSKGIILPEIKDGKLYSIHTINEHRDWESGMIDDFDLEIFELEEENDGFRRTGSRTV